MPFKNEIPRPVEYSTFVARQYSNGYFGVHTVCTERHKKNQDRSLIILSMLHVGFVVANDWISHSCKIFVYRPTNM